MSHGYVEPTDVPPDQRCMAERTWDVVLDLYAVGRLRLIWHDLRGTPSARTRKSRYSVAFTDGEGDGDEVVPFEALGYNDEMGLYDKRTFPDVRDGE